MQDKRDSSVVDTALREAEEEISLHRDQLTVVSVLPPFLAVYSHVVAVHVVVCVLQTSRLELSLSANSEVEKIFWAPLQLFVKEANHWKMDLPWKGSLYTAHFFGYNEKSTAERYIIWGLTSRICVVLASIVLQAPVPFVSESYVLVKKGSNDGSEWEITFLRTPIPTSKL